MKLSHTSRLNVATTVVLIVWASTARATDKTWSGSDGGGMSWDTRLTAELLRQEAEQLLKKQPPSKQ